MIQRHFSKILLTNAGMENRNGSLPILHQFVLISYLVNGAQNDSMLPGVALLLLPHSLL